MQWSEINYTAKDFACPCGCTMPRHCEENLLLLAAELQKLRKFLGTPLGIVRGYVCAKENKRIGGKAASRHLKGAAIKVTLIGRSGEYLSGVVETLIRLKRLKNGSLGTFKDADKQAILHYDLSYPHRRWRE
jgi:hypothetical protein